MDREESPDNAAGWVNEPTLGEEPLQELFSGELIANRPELAFPDMLTAAAGSNPHVPARQVSHVRATLRLGHISREIAAFEARHQRRLAARARTNTDVHPELDPNYDVWMSRPTPNLFTNTSLEESNMPPGTATPHDVFHGLIQDPDSDDDDAWEPPAADAFYVAAGTSHAQLRHERDAQAKAARREQRLIAHRLSEKSFMDEVKRTLSEWKTADPVAAKKYGEHFENCCLAASTMVRIIDLALWFPAFPREVRMSLNDLAKYYHIEAALQVMLQKAEAETESWGENPYLHKEILYAAQHTKIVVHSGGRTEYKSLLLFGHGKELCGIQDFDDEIFLEKGEERKYLVRVQASLAVRKLVFETLHQGDFKAGKKWEDTIDYHLLLWCRDAKTALEDSLARFNSQEVEKETKQLYVEVHNQVKTMAMELEAQQPENVSVQTGPGHHH